MKYDLMTFLIIHCWDAKIKLLPGSNCNLLSLGIPTK